ncbi:ankyrin homolog [Plakobranchus ocellatus]|uniref:Ankyrin homolog n=1 Tax=Plakobranchus ocellatus TaxID=259542 RepID=A0AAV4D765_9GAST|nr:ankyrin homolog [Plakobranchus ocellatus]
MEDQRDLPYSPSSRGKKYKNKLRGQGSAGNRGHSFNVNKGLSRGPHDSTSRSRTFTRHAAASLYRNEPAATGNTSNNNNRMQASGASHLSKQTSNHKSCKYENEGGSTSCQVMEDQPPEDLGDQSQTPGQKLHLAMMRRDMSAVDLLLDQHQVSENDHIEQTHLDEALLEACRAGQKFYVHKLVRCGAVVNVKRLNHCTTALHIAAQHGFLDITDFLLSKGANVNAFDSDFNTALILAVNPAGCTDMLNLLLVHNAKVHFQNIEGMTALMKAVQVKDIDAIRILMLAGSDLRRKNKEGHTAKDIAVRQGIADVYEALKYETGKHSKHSTPPSALTKAMLDNHKEAVRILLDSRHSDSEGKIKVKYRFTNENSKNATLYELVRSMCDAANKKKKPDRVKLEMAKILFDSGAQPDKGSKSSVSLIEATQAGVYELVEVICKYKHVRPNHVSNGRTALMIAAELGRTDILKLLLANRADAKVTNSMGDTALSIALSSGQIECSKILLQVHKPTEVDLQRMAEKVVDSGKHEALHLLASHCNIDEISQSLLRPAVLSGSIETVQFLLDKGADVNVPSSCGSAALVVALGRLKDPELIKMVTFLVENGAHVNKSVSAESPLVCAVSDNPTIVRYLLDNGADINEIGDNQGNTPLMAAFRLKVPYEMSRHPDMVETLLDAGADPNIANSLGDTALHMAVAEGSVGTIRQLVEAGAELEVRDSNGLTPLLLATNTGHADVIGLLKRCGANMTAVDKDGNSPLVRVLLVCSAPQEETLRILAYDKEQLNKKTRDGMTPLMIAAEICNVNVIKILLGLGANPNITNKSSDKTVTALSILLDNIQIKRNAMPCAEELIRHNGLATVPKRCCLALFQMIMSDRRQMVQLMVTHGMAPLCVDFISLGSSVLGTFMLGIGNSVGHNLSPLGAALVRSKIAVARYLVENWFLTPADLVGSPQLRDLRSVLESTSRPDSLSFMDEHLSQPMSLVKISFVAVSALLGEMSGREKRVRKTPLPVILQDRLLFRHEIFQMDLSSEGQGSTFLDGPFDELERDDISSYDSSDYFYDSDMILDTYNSDDEFLF